MAILDRQTIVVPMGGGLEKELADKLVPAGKTLDLQNSRIDQTGRVTKRAGNFLIPSVGATNFWQSGTRAGALVSLQSNGALPIAAYSSGAGRWAVPGNGITTDLRGPVTTRRLPAFSGTSASVESPSCAYMASVNCYIAVFDGQGATLSAAAPRMEVIDATTGQVIFTLLSGPGWRPRVIVVGDTAIIAYSSAGVIGGYALTAANILAGTAGTFFSIAAAGAHATDPYIDLISISLTVYVAYRSNVNTTRMVTIAIPGLATTATPITDSVGAAIDPALGLAWMTDPAGSGKLSLITLVGAGVQVQWNINIGTGVAGITYNMAGANIYTNCTGHTISNAATGEFVVLTDEATTNTRFHTRTVAGGIATGEFIRGISLRSKTFRSNGDDYVILSYYIGPFLTPCFQKSYFLVRVSPTHLTTPVRTPIARIMLWQGNGPTEHSSGLTSVVLIPGTGQLVCALPKVTTTEASASLFAQDVGLDLVTLSFGAPTGAPKEATDMLLVPGGSLLAFDGQSYCEDGFPLYPEAPSTPGVETAGGLSAGLYSWRTVFRYTDANGRINRSKPSPVLQHTISAGAKRVDIRMNTACLNARPGSIVTIELYRGVVNDNSVYRLVGSSANDPTVDFVTFSDGVSDAVLQLAEPLYTTGGVLGNDPTPGTRAVLFHRDRVWYLSDDDRRELGFSDVAAPFLGWQFSQSRIIRIDDEYGDMTAIGGLGQNTVVFKREAFYAINGDGPNSLGQLSFNDSVRIEEGIGCIEPRSVVAAPPGLFFQSARGIYLWPGGGPAEFVGRSIAPLTVGVTIVAAIHVAARSQVRFYTSGGAFVYDYLHQQWSTDLYGGPLSLACVTAWGGFAALSATSLGVLAEDQTGTFFSDNGVNFVRKESSPWLSLDGLAGVERWYELQGIGDSASAHTLSAQIQYDTDAGPTSTPQTKSFAPGESWEWRLRPARQLATAIKVTLSETGSGAGYSLVALAFILGVEPAHLKRFQAQAKSLL